MKNIIDIYEGSLSSNKLDESSILADIDDTIKSGDKYKAVDLEMLMNAKSESEFNTLYEILKDNIVSTQKTPEIVINPFGVKSIKTKPDEYYIVFYTRKDGNKEFPSLLFGNKFTVSACWHPIRNKLITSWSNIGFGDIPHKNEIKILPKEWSKQVANLLKKSNYR
jgi:hypothetical protein